MSHLLRLLVLGAVLSMLGSCGAGDSSGENPAGQAPPPVSHTVFAPYVREINKARQVQNVLQAQKQALDRQIQAQSGASRTPAPPAQTPR